MRSEDWDGAGRWAQVAMIQFRDPGCSVCGANSWKVLYTPMTLPPCFSSRRFSQRGLLYGLTLLFLLVVVVGCSRIGTPQGWSAGSVAGENLFIGTMEGEVLAVHKETGGLAWRRQIPTSEDSDRAIYGRPAVSDDAVFVGGYDGILYAYDRQGDLMWQEPLPGQIVGGPTVHGGRVLIGTGTVSSSDGSGGALHAIDIESNDPLWTYQANGPVWSTPTVDHDVVLVGSLDHNVYAVNLDDGSEKWRFRSGGAVTSGIAVADGRVIFGSFDSTLYALDVETGNLVWRFDGSSSWYWSAPLVYDDVVYAPSLDGALYAIDAKTGDLSWVFDSEGGQLVGSPATVNELLAVPVADGGDSRIALLEQNGSLLAACRIGDDVRTSLEVDGDLIYFGAKDSTIRALRIKGNGNPDEEWVFVTNEDDPHPSDRPKAC